LAPTATNGALTSFFHTISAGNYDQFSLTGTLHGKTIAGLFNNDGGSGAGAINGNVTLTRP